MVGTSQFYSLISSYRNISRVHHVPGTGLDIRDNTEQKIQNFFLMDLMLGRDKVYKSWHGYRV